MKLTKFLCMGVAVLLSAAVVLSGCANPSGSDNGGGGTGEGEGTISAVTYSLVSGVGDDDNTWFVVEGSSLKIATAGMTTKTKVYSVRVAANSNGQTFARPCTVAVTTPPLNVATISNASELSSFIAPTAPMGQRAILWF